MRKIFHPLIAAGFVFAASALAQARVQAHAAPETQAVTLVSFKSEVYELSEGAQTSILFKLWASQPTTVTIKTGNVVYTSELDTAASGKTFEGEVHESGWLTIEGDPEAVYGIDLSGNYITSADFSAWTGLEQLELAHNNLDSLDLSPNTALTYLDISDNPFRPDKLVLGTNHPHLAYLNISMIETFPASGPALTHFPELLVYEAYSTYGYTSLDFSQCPKIKKITFDNSDVSTCVLGPANADLRILNISNCAYRYPGGDFKDFPLLRELYLDHSVTPDYRLTEVNVSQNPELVYLFVQGNRLTELDVTHNPALISLYADNNRLSSLDVSKNTLLQELVIHRNRFTFATLPEPLEQYGYYVYGYQNPLPAAYEYTPGDTLDLSGMVLREGSETYCTMWSVDPRNPAESVELVAGVDYRYTDGKVVMLRAQTHPVYLAFSNSLFPGEGDEAKLSTTQFLIRNEEDYGKPTKRFSIMPENNLQNFRVEISPCEGRTFAPQEEIPPLYVDWGDGQPVRVNASNGSTFLLSHSDVAYKNISVYLDLGYEITALASDSNRFITVDLTGLFALQSLSLHSAGLYGINLGYNQALRYLSLSDNRIGSLDLDGATAYFTKTLLNEVEVKNNQLTAFKLSDMSSLTALNLSANQLPEIDLSGATRLATLDLSHNTLEELNLSRCEALSEIRLNNNRLSGLDLPHNNWQTLDISDNRFTFATLPKTAPRPGYCYAPQAPIQIPAKGAGIHLSAQLFTQETPAGTFTTQIKLFKQDGTLLQEQLHYTLQEGYVSFVNLADSGKVYAELTHGAYPDFSGEKALKTTLIEAAEVPSHLIATFTCTGRCETSLYLGSDREGGSLYIDWGNGIMESYELYAGTPIPSQSATTISGGNVKIYAYEGEEAAPLTVFSLSGVPMKDLEIIDFNSVTGLTLSSCGLTEIDLTNAPNVTELTLSDNSLSEIDLSKATSLNYLVLSGNKFQTVNLTGLDRLGWLALDNNLLESIDLSVVPGLWSLSLSGNALTEIDLSALTELHQISLWNNRLNHIDLSNNSILRVLDISQNEFTFATLPLPQEQWTIYIYNSQATLLPEPLNGCEIDLTEQAFVAETPTLFYWFAGSSYEIDEEGYVYPQPLTEGEDYVISEGYVKFLKTFDTVCALMVNERLPKIYLNALATCIKPGMGGDENENGNETALTSARCKVRGVRGGLLVSEAGADVKVEVYKADGRKMRQTKTDASGSVFVPVSVSGLYIVKAGTETRKVILR